MQNPYQVVHDFESALCEYTGAPYCVTTTSCTMAILLACRWHYLDIEEKGYEYPGGPVTIPSRTYVGVPMSIIHAGFEVSFHDTKWRGDYPLHPLPVVDSARLLTTGMYEWQDPGTFVCVSFHPTKHLGISTGGGAILLDDPEAAGILRMMRFDGRDTGIQLQSQKDWVMGWHANMSPMAAAEGLLRLSTLPRNNDPLPNSDYPDLRKLEIFK